MLEMLSKEYKKFLIKWKERKNPNCRQKDRRIARAVMAI